LAAGTRTLSKNTSVVAWFIIVRIGRIVRPAFKRLAHVEDEDRQALGALGDLLARRGAGQQQHQVGLRGPAGPDLLAVDDVMIALAPGGRAQAVVSVPLVGSVTPKACSRNSPEAIFGR
jgi:hypothetical protein